MSNIRTRKPRILIEPPYIPSTLNKKHVGTRVQFSSSTDFTDTSAMIYDKTTYAPDDILNIQITQQDGQPLEISLDDVYYFRYQLIYDSVSAPTNNPDLYTKDVFSVIASIYGDQEGFRYDHIIISTPLVTAKEETGVLGNNNLIINATGYKTIVGSGKHKYTTWVVETSDGEEILRREKDRDNLESVSIPMSIFKAGKLYALKAKFISDTNGESNYGKCLFNVALAQNEYMEVEPSGDLQYGNDLFFKFTTKIPNVTGVTAKLYSVVGNTEVEIPTTITTSTRTLRISSFTNINGSYSLTPTKSITNVFKLYVRPIINGNTNVIWSDMITYAFMLSYPEVYPLEYSSNYPGQYSMLKDINVGPTAMVSKELKNGIIPLLISGSKKVKLYARYGNAVRPTNIEFELPISYDNVVIPYINFIELYNGEVAVNYTVLENGGTYKRSGWAFYNVDYSTNTWILLCSKIFNDEYFNTGISSSAVVGRNNKILYIPDQFFINGYVEKNPNVPFYFGCINYDPIQEISYSGGVTLNQSTVSSGFRVVNVKVGSNMVQLEYADDIIRVKNIHDGYLSGDALDVSDLIRTQGYVELSLSIPKEFSPDVVFTSGEMNICNMGNLNITIPYSDLTERLFKVKFSTSSSGDLYSGELVRGDDIVIGIKYDRTVYVNGVEIGKLNDSLSEFSTFYLFKRNGSPCVECNFRYIAFSGTTTEIPFTYIRRADKFQSDLPLISLSREGGNVVRKIELPEIKSTIKKHLTLAPLTTDVNNESFIVLGGTTNDEIEIDPAQPGITKYALANREIGILTQAGSGWNIDWLQSNGLPVTLPVSLVPEDYYSLSAFRRYDGKIVIFNNCVNGPGAEDTSSYVLDVTKITSTELQEGWFVKNNNDSRIDLPFRSTIQMRNGDFLRLSYQETLTSGDLSCKVLIYPHQPLTDYTDTDAPVTVNKNLVVPVGSVISIENPYIYESITIEGNSPDNTGILLWTDKNELRSLDYTYRFITRDTVTPTAEVQAMGKEKFIVLDGVNWRIDG